MAARAARDSLGGLRGFPTTPSARLQESAAPSRSVVFAAVFDGGRIYTKKAPSGTPAGRLHF